MKIIVSHDVDHLYRSDHYKDLIYPKLWVRETISFIKNEIDFSQWKGRLIGTLKNKRNYIDELIKYDKKNDIPSTFFFGMTQGLGMSYKPDKVKPFLIMAQKNGFDVGVHGIAYNDKDEMKKEFYTFKNLFGFKPEGIRMHYVRYDDNTFKNLSKIGYVYDSSEFDKEKGTCLKNPYKVNDLWEFPLCLMDGYLPKLPKGKKERSLELLKKAEEKNLQYFTVLFHDNQFCDAYSYERDWYIWFTTLLKERGYEFISFADAVRELKRESKEKNND